MRLHRRCLLFFKKTFTVPRRSEGWIYTSLANTTATWAAAAGCSGTAVGVDVLPSVGFEADRFLKCRQYTHCPAPKAVMWCVFDGLHADWPYGLEDLVWWFFKKAVG